MLSPDYKKIKEGDEVKWPTPDVLRPGTKAVGWIILDEVPMWYELWRVLNGFPPTIIYTPEKQGLSKIKAK